MEIFYILVIFQLSTTAPVERPTADTTSASLVKRPKLTLSSVHMMTCVLKWFTIVILILLSLSLKGPDLVESMWRVQSQIYMLDGKLM